MSLLDQIHSPADLRALPESKLPALAEEIRQRILQVVGHRGGHLTSNLGITELTIALHRAFDFGHDRLLWDVGHQCYPHKLLTGRHRRFDSLRQAGGVSGFPSIHESEYDLFDVGHAGTSVATAVGMARAAEILGEDRRVVALIGDASIVNGVAFEGLNQAGTLRRQFLVVLNDNEWGISPTQGAIAEYLARFRASNFYDDVKDHTKKLLPRLPLLGKPVFEMIAHLKEGIKATVSPGQVFEAMGLQYVGPVDGHDIHHLIEILDVLKRANHPVLLHVHTTKGKGCDWASAEPGKYHSPKPFAMQNGKVTIKGGAGKSWTHAFVESLIELAEHDKRIYAMTAGMPDGTGLNKFMERFPDRARDIGIAESATVDIAAGMARAGLRPVAAIYSTFLQRAFDQVFQEVVLQGLPVMFCLDRAGLVGGDGAVHHGFLDVTYLRGFPNMVLMAPCDEPELRAAMKLGITLDQPSAIRYPRDNVPTPLADCPPFELGRSRRLREGDDATILCYGVTTINALAAADMLADQGIEVAVVNARFAKPVDREMVRRAFERGRPVVTVEDHSTTGGFGSAVLETAHELGLSGAPAMAGPDASNMADAGSRESATTHSDGTGHTGSQGTPAVSSPVVRLGMPNDRFIPHGSRGGQLAECSLDATGIAATVQDLIESHDANPHESNRTPPPAAPDPHPSPTSASA